jgi:hypothetical protein
LQGEASYRWYDASWIRKAGAGTRSTERDARLGWRAKWRDGDISTREESKSPRKLPAGNFLGGLGWEGVGERKFTEEEGSATFM